jgi:hypothetical protein
MAFSKPFTLGGDYFNTEISEEASTVRRLPVTPAPQSVIDTAASSGNLNGDGSINYVKVLRKDQYQQLAAPDSWMGSLANDTTYWNTIDQSIGGENPNVGVDENLPFSGGILETNTDPNDQPNAPSDVTLRYPLNNTGGYDFLQISTYELNRNADLLKGDGLKISGPDESLGAIIGPVIALPMQPGISDSNSVDWGSDSLNPIQLALAAAAGTGIKTLGNDFSIQGFGEAASNMMKSVKSSILSAGSEISQNDIISYFAGQAAGANIFTRSTGKVINPNLELLFRGPQMRSFNYNYTFTPRDPDEAKVIKTIIKHFKKTMAVQRGGLFLKTPNVYKLQYVYAGGGQHPFLNKIKTCALTNFNVQYTPDGSYMTYKDGSMTSYSVSMQFSELTPIYNEDYDNSDDMGY